jgi:hypothetical protein
LDGKNCCVLRDNQGLCTCYTARPLACQSYPLSLKTQDAFNQLIILDLDCPAIRSNDAAYRNLDPKKLAEIFPEEYPVARRLLAREKAMQLALRLKAKELGIQGVIEWDRIVADHYRWQDWKRIDVLPDD